MPIDQLIIPMVAHVAWAALLYVVLTIVRAPAVWNVGSRPDGSNPMADLELRVSANLTNQFEWPVVFYAACLVVLVQQESVSLAQVTLAWIFVAGRITHSGVQILTTNIRLRGVVFTINFVAALGLWATILASAASG